MKSKKTLLCLLVVFVVVLGAIGLAGLFREESPKKLSKLSDEELFQFLSDHGITFSENFTIDDIRTAVAYIEENPDYEPDFSAISWSEPKKLFTAVRNAVKEYYGINIEK